MTPTNDQWSKDLAAEDDDGFGFPEAPAFELPAETEIGYTALDEPDLDNDSAADPTDEPAHNAAGARGFGDCRDPENEYGVPGEDVADGYDDYPVDGQALSGPVGDGQPAATEPRRARRFDGKVAMGFGAAGLVAVLVAIVGAVAVYGSDEPKPTGAAPNGADAIALPPTRSAAPAPAPPPMLDRPISFTADALGSCAEGSTSAQTMAGTDPHAAFVCVRGGGDGQVIDLELEGGTHMITAIVGEFGWVGTDASGSKPWSQYRVVRLVQYTFNDTDTTLVTQDTKNVHGEATQPIKRVLASKIRILIRETARPPAQPAGGASTAPTKPNGPLGLELPQLPGVLGGGQQNSDPVDAAFAIKSLKIIGHKPV